MASRADVLDESTILEDYQKRSQQPYTRYSLGVMEQVSFRSTQISLEEADRVGKQLLVGLTAKGITVDFRLQGSVPANIHIRKVSDVDLLVLDDRFFSYDSNGPRKGDYNNPISYTPLSALQTLRGYSETILTDKFPEAEVDTSGAKAINISGGSLRRPVDVVPSHWHNTVDYQASFQEYDRGVHILDKKNAVTLLNMPFRHIKRIGEHDDLSMRGLKKAIRLCKNVKNDALDEGNEIALSSFDIASALWHADLKALRLGANNELAILAETQRHLNNLSRNHLLAKALSVPDGSRTVFDADAKLRALDKLSAEVDDLAFEVSQEQNQALKNFNPSWLQINETLEKAYIPFV
jgi:hypothetical protein